MNGLVLLREAVHRTVRGLTIGACPPLRAGRRSRRGRYRWFVCAAGAGVGDAAENAEGYALPNAD